MKYQINEDDDEPITSSWVFANFPQSAPNRSSRSRNDCRFLVWLNRFERFELHGTPVVLKTRGCVRMILFALAGIDNLDRDSNTCPCCKNKYKEPTNYEYY